MGRPLSFELRLNGPIELGRELLLSSEKLSYYIVNTRSFCKPPSDAV